MEKFALSSSMEDYLETIALLVEESGHAHTKEIAEKLKVKMPSVSNALIALSERGLINYQPHSPVSLTAAGAEVASVIRHRHNSLKRFFSELLLLAENEADEAACKVEHTIGEKVMSRIVTLSDAVLEREDCSELRKYLRKTMPQICAENAEKLIPLADLKEGESGVVVRVAESLRGVKKFADLGLVSGTLLKLEGSAPFGDLLRIKVMGCSLSLRRRDAAYIWVRKTK